MKSIPDISIPLRKYLWTRYLAVLLLGALTSLAMAPYLLWPVPFVTFPFLLVCLRACTTRRVAFFTGWLFAFGYFVAGLYWIAYALTVDTKTFGWLIPFAAIGLPALFAIYYGFAALIWHELRQRKLIGGLGQYIIFALLWFAAEWLRGHLFTGFPWNLLGYAWGDLLAVMQITSVTGIYGLTLLTLVAACLPAFLYDLSVKRRQGYAALGIACVLFIGIAFWGQTRLNHATSEMLTDVNVRLVQPSIRQDLKWKAEQREENFQKLLELSALPSEQPITHVIWPETATTFLLAENTDRRLAIIAALPDHATLLTGALRRVKEDDKIVFYNSLLAIDHRANVIAGYDKAHLVPFGEYVPLRGFAPVASLASGTGDFSPGPGPRSLRIPDFPLFSPLICYEAIFPHGVTDETDPPQILLNVTNDAWYGRTSGPPQHFQIAATRAIEQGLPLIRVANNGISGFVDPYGRVLKKLELDAVGILDGTISVAIGPTLFSHYGNGMLVLLLISFMGISILLRS